jgi:two-component system, LytTR family, sensor kinase
MHKSNAANGNTWIDFYCTLCCTHTHWLIHPICKIIQFNCYLHLQQMKSFKKPHFVVAQLLFWSVFTLYNSAPNILLEPNKTLLYKSMVMVFCSGLGCTFVYAYILKRIHFDYQNLKKIFIAIAIGSFCGILFFNRFQYWVFYDEIKADLVKNNMSELAYHVSDIVVSVTIILPWFLLYHFVKYIDVVYKQRQLLLLTENQMKQLQIQNMLNKLNPHFLFNTLNTIKWQVNNNQQEARNSIDKISNILRYNIDDQHAARLIDDEVNIVQQYLEIEKIRFEERLNYSITVEPHLKAQFIIPFLILNLVENGIKHGIAKVETDGMLSVCIQEKDSTICINVSNTGQLSPSKDDGFGLQSLQSLLQNKYGDAAFIKIAQTNLHVVTVTIQYPINA